MSYAPVASSQPRFEVVGGSVRFSAAGSALTVDPGLFMVVAGPRFCATSTEALWSPSETGWRGRHQRLPLAFDIAIEERADGWWIRGGLVTSEPLEVSHAGCRLLLAPEYQAFDIGEPRGVLTGPPPWHDEELWRGVPRDEALTLHGPLFGGVPPLRLAISPQSHVAALRLFRPSAHAGRGVEVWRYAVDHGQGPLRLEAGSFTLFELQLSFAPPRRPLEQQLREERIHRAAVWFEEPDEAREAVVVAVLRAALATPEGGAGAGALAVVGRDDPIAAPDALIVIASTFDHETDWRSPLLAARLGCRRIARIDPVGDMKVSWVGGRWPASLLESARRAKTVTIRNRRVAWLLDAS